MLVIGGAEQVGKITRIRLGVRIRHDVGWADQPIHRHNADCALPHPHHIVSNIALGRPLVLRPIRHLLPTVAAFEVSQANARPDGYFQDRKIGVSGLLPRPEKPAISP
jgi:hypothetical protein